MAAMTEAQRKYQREWSRKRRQDPAYARQGSVQARNWQKANPIRFALTNTKKGAERKGFAWAIPDELAIDLITDRCFYCGGDPKPTNGIDRVDNQRGYVEDNVVTACRDCNYSKRERPVGAFLAWAQRLAARLPMIGGM